MGEKGKRKEEGDKRAMAVKCVMLVCTDSSFFLFQRKKNNNLLSLFISLRCVSVMLKNEIKSATVLYFFFYIFIMCCRAEEVRNKKKTFNNFYWFLK